MRNEVPRGNAKNGRMKLSAGLGANDIRLPWKQKEKQTEIRRGKKRSEIKKYMRSSVSMELKRSEVERPAESCRPTEVPGKALEMLL